MSGTPDFIEAMRRIMLVAHPDDVRIIVENANTAKVAAALAEREACARAAEAIGSPAFLAFAAAIRARK